MPVFVVTTKDEEPTNQWEIDIAGFGVNYPSKITAIKAKPFNMMLVAADRFELTEHGALIFYKEDRIKTVINATYWLTVGEKVE